MRRIASSGLIGLGAFLIVAAALMKFYAYPALAKVPTNYESTTMLEAKDAEIFDATTLAPLTTDLTVESFTIADSSVDAPDGVAVWVNRSSITRDDVPGATCEGSTKPGCFQQTSERGAFDEVSGAAIGCEVCASSIDVSDSTTGDVTSDPVERSGQWLKFPFDTQKKDYLQWDGNIEKATPAVYSGTEKIDGLEVYKFVQTIPETLLDGTRELPGKVFGLTDPTVDASTYYTMTRTFYIDPATGAPVNRVEDRTQEFEYDGTRVTAFTGTVQYTAAQVKDSVDTAKSKGMVLGGMQLLFPLIALVLGLLAIAGGVLLGRGDRGDGSATPADRRHLVNA
ncbi:DUF3068 domain-containing protein [Nocardioides rubriscoriae]|uniref:DUF3068 domain-containing protein n=1 Tax=Nocardioides rubriscoriae TaxID=642762 RepID=UPI0011E01030|nr:DUF3068 domain-containing protein [Nocardioides rubriscoriae]